VLEEADACAVVPMVGMVESLNVSVAAALMLHEARRGRMAALVRSGAHASTAAPWTLVSKQLCDTLPLQLVDRADVVWGVLPAVSICTMAVSPVDHEPEALL
jgi:hypothetical protein